MIGEHGRPVCWVRTITLAAAGAMLASVSVPTFAAEEFDPNKPMICSEHITDVEGELSALNDEAAKEPIRKRLTQANEALSGGDEKTCNYYVAKARLDLKYALKKQEKGG